MDQDLCYKLRSFINKNRPINNKIFYKTEMEFQKKVDTKITHQELVIILLKIVIRILLRLMKVSKIFVVQL